MARRTAGRVCPDHLIAMPIDNPGVTALPTLGTAALADIGTDPGDVPVFDEQGRLPPQPHTHDYAPSDHTHQGLGGPILVLTFDGRPGTFGILGMSDLESRFLGATRTAVGRFQFEISGATANAIVLCAGGAPAVNYGVNATGFLTVNCRSSSGSFQDNVMHIALFRL